MIQAISSAEKEFTRKGCDANIRFDGRGKVTVDVSPLSIHGRPCSKDLYRLLPFTGSNDFRHISVENNVLPHVNGSSRLRVGDSIDILCSVKVVNEKITLRWFRWR